MPKAIVEIQGRSTEWGIVWDASVSQIEEMRADGLQVGIVENSVPFWIASAGLTRAWCFFQDVWNLKNPFGNK